MTFKRTILPTAAAVAALAFAAVAATPTLAQMKEQTVTVGGAPMYPSKNIIQNAVNSKDHTTLVAVLTYHVLPGRHSVKDLWEASNKGGGKAKFKTVEGEELTVEFKGQVLTVRDSKGNASRVSIQNVFQSNGVIHVIDNVLMPS